MAETVPREEMAQERGADPEDCSFSAPAWGLTFLHEVLRNGIN